MSSCAIFFKPFPFLSMYWVILFFPPHSQSFMSAFYVLSYLVGTVLWPLPIPFYWTRSSSLPLSLSLVLSHPTYFRSRLSLHCIPAVCAHLIDILYCPTLHCVVFLPSHLYYTKTLPCLPVPRLQAILHRSFVHYCIPVLCLSLHLACHPSRITWLTVLTGPMAPTFTVPHDSHLSIITFLFRAAHPPPSAVRRSIHKVEAKRKSRPAHRWIW